MPDTSPPGAHAYAAYLATLALEPYAPTYNRLATEEHIAWEAAAQAVLAQQKEEPHA